MLITRICPDCEAKWSQFENLGRSSQDWLYSACSDCLERRRAKLREREKAVYGEPLPPIQNHPYSDVPKVLVNPPWSSGRRVIRKSEPMGG